ncbi:hypothetical protein EVJ58_g10741 [Rhodofomes roseus]|uniref:Uncharacterized protein n=1 Tax=Rhodofomes roseus TaxID=34475 RepID=A0A4Y9XP06_9APHY|nr:hypothetical protein EVJ58_g10741 [Rhodofomes roseus]
MAPRSSSKTSGRGFQPAYDAATYRDLLLFEERLKTNAASLNRRKHRYQLFLAQLLVIITFLASEVLLQTNVLSIPYAVLLRAAFSDLYTERTDISIHPYFTTARRSDMQTGTFVLVHVAQMFNLGDAALGREKVCAACEPRPPKFQHVLERPPASTPFQTACLSQPLYSALSSTNAGIGRSCRSASPPLPFAPF